MKKIAILSDVHGNLTALNAVLKDIKTRKIKKIFCLGDCVTKGVNPDKVIDILQKKCEVILIGNTDYAICRPEFKNKSFWSRKKIGEQRAEYLYNLPKMYEFYLSGHLIRLFHATPHNLDGIYNPMYSNKNSAYKHLEILNPDILFENTEFINRSSNDPTPDIVGYGHIHTPFVVRHKNKTIFNTGSVGMPIEMSNKSPHDKTNKLSTLASYTILEGNLNSKSLSTISISQIRVPYDIEKEINYIKQSDIPNKDNIILSLKTAISEKNF